MTKQSGLSKSDGETIKRKTIWPSSQGSVSRMGRQSKQTAKKLGQGKQGKDHPLPPPQKFTRATIFSNDSTTSN